MKRRDFVFSAAVAAVGRRLAFESDRTGKNRIHLVERARSTWSPA